MTPNREQFFALGVALGTALGFALGSVLARGVGDASLGLARHLVGRIAGHEEHPRFELLLQ